MKSAADAYNSPPDQRFQYSSMQGKRKALLIGINYKG